MESDLSEALLSKDKTDSGTSSGKFDPTKIFCNEYNNGNRNSEKYFLANCRSVESICKIFKSNLETGLDSNNKQDLEWREREWGNNHLPPEMENSILAHIIECFEDPCLRILLGAAIISLLIGILKDGIKNIDQFFKW